MQPQQQHWPAGSCPTEKPLKQASPCLRKLLALLHASLRVALPVVLLLLLLLLLLVDLLVGSPLVMMLHWPAGPVALLLGSQSAEPWQVQPVQAVKRQVVLFPVLLSLLVQLLLLELLWLLLQVLVLALS